MLMRGHPRTRCDCEACREERSERLLARLSILTLFAELILIVLGILVLSVFIAERI